MQYVQGHIFTSGGFEKGYLGFEAGTIIERGQGPSPGKSVAEGIIVPTFVNAHTHIGDSFIRKKETNLPRTVEELVAPPDGLKHRLLSSASDKEIIAGMEESIRLMMEGGISFFCDFREGGIRGIEQIRKTLVNKPLSSCIFARPEHMTYQNAEVDLLLENSNGIGLSSIRDWDYSEIGKIAHHVRRKKKLFALHASEAVREDIDGILDLKPTLLVHMVKASESDLIRVKEQGIPIVLCPRSNAFFGLQPDFKLLKRIGVPILLGTDNAMLQSPDILAEVQYIRSCTDVFSIEHLLYMIIYAPRKALNLECDILGPNQVANFIVLDKESLTPLYHTAGLNEG